MRMCKEAFACLKVKCKLVCPNCVTGNKIKLAFKYEIFSIEKSVKVEYTQIFTVNTQSGRLSSVVTFHTDMPQCSAKRRGRSWKKIFEKWPEQWQKNLFFIILVY